ncbi:MAG: hypothetical protein OHK0013_48720 [Sandaracinaceae bacterium]
MDERDEQRAVREVAAEASSVVTRSSGALATSVVVHALVVTGLLALPSRFALDERYGTQEVSIEFSAPVVDVPPPPVDPEPEPTFAEPSAPTTLTRQPPRSTPSAGTIEPAASVGTAVAPSEPVGPEIQAPSVTQEPGQLPSDPEERRRLAALLNPNAAAASWVVAGAAGPSQPSGPAGLTATGGRPTLASEAEVEAALSGHLRGRAMARPWTSREPPRLVPRPDGSLEYRGHAFTARIAPDGAVSFSDRDAIQADEMLQGGPARFDLTDLAMRGAGQDPYAAEREWFMEQTEEVRARLETEARAREREAALRGVPGRLASIWNSDLPASVRRRRIFRMWDECDEEGDGLVVRRQVIEFVRAQVPANSPDAFTVEELRRWNNERESEMEFDPY